MRRRERQIRARRGFTLLEVMIAMAILALALVALSDINAGAIAMHSYAKRLTVATFLAKGKMLDIESKLDAEGLPSEGDNISPSDGSFDEEGFPEYKWKAEVVAPKADNLDPTKLINLVLGGGNSADGSSSSSSPGSGLGAAGGGLLGMLMGGSSPSPSSSSSAAPSNPTSSGLSGGMAGMAGGMLGAPAQMMMTQITQMVREVHLTVTWMDGKNPQEFTIVEHIVSMGPNTPLNGTGNNGTKNTGGLQTNVPGQTTPPIGLDD